MENGVYNVLTQTGEVGKMAALYRDGKMMPLKATACGNWFPHLDRWFDATPEQSAKLALNGRADSQTVTASWL